MGADNGEEVADTPHATRHRPPTTRTRTRTRIRNMTSYTCATGTPKRVLVAAGAQGCLCGMRHVARVVWHSRWQRLSSRQCPANSFRLRSHYARAAAARGNNNGRQTKNYGDIIVSALTYIIRSSEAVCAQRRRLGEPMHYIFCYFAEVYFVVSLKTIFMLIFSWLINFY